MSTEKQRRAYAIVNKARKKGIIYAPCGCELCGVESSFFQEALNAHHFAGYDLGHELDVVWLCHACHSRVHGNKRKALSLSHPRCDVKWITIDNDELALNATTRTLAYLILISIEALKQSVTSQS